MSLLSQIQQGRETLPPRFLLYGQEGIGKSSFGASAPQPIFIQIEDGLAEIDCHKFPRAFRLAEVTASLDALATEDHPYQTVVVDSADWFERLVFDRLCEEHSVASIEQVLGGYGKGYSAALPYWREFLDRLDRLRHERGMAIILIAHSKVERVEDPEGPAFDRFTPRLHKHACALLSEWCDAVLFATQKKRVATEDSGFNRKRGIAHALGKDGGERIIRTVGGPACVAKNRYGLPPELELSWSVFMAAMAQTAKDN